jgi:alpha-galactosidase
MGYNTWYDFRCKINEADVKGAANALVHLGLDKLGYKYVNMDDCWAAGRFKNGTVYPNSTNFPSGIKALADYVHALGLKFGVYTDRGTKTCGGFPGSLGYEKIDAQTYASWGVDFLKEDSCNAVNDPTVAFPQYSRMRDALNATGRPILFSLCGWEDWYPPVGTSLGNMWRINHDGKNWTRVINNINTMASLSYCGGPGGWNDPDMLLGTSHSSWVSVTQDQSRSQFSLWSIMNAPLIIGSSILNLNAFDLQTYSNPLLISANQEAGVAGRRIAGSQLTLSTDPTLGTQWNVWSKTLKNGAAVLVFFNVAKLPMNITCDPTCILQTGLQTRVSGGIEVWDLWDHLKLGDLDINVGWTATNVNGNGGSQTLGFFPQ